MYLKLAEADRDGCKRYSSVTDPARQEWMGRVANICNHVKKPGCSLLQCWRRGWHNIRCSKLEQGAGLISGTVAVQQSKPGLQAKLRDGMKLGKSGEGT